jgi:hypothetical protein
VGAAAAAARAQPPGDEAGERAHSGGDSVRLGRGAAPLLLHGSGRAMYNARGLSPRRLAAEERQARFPPLWRALLTR